MTPIPVDTKSRLVKRYVRSCLSAARLFRQLEAEEAIRNVTYAKLTGGQIGEARRLLREHGLEAE